MWWRNPWLQNRKRLLGLAVVDALLIIGSYYALYLRLFHQPPGFSRSALALVTFWLGASYLLGRYSRPEKGESDSRRRRIVTTLVVTGLVLGIVVVIFAWGLKVGYPSTFRRFLVPQLAIVTLGSVLAQLWLLRQQQKRRSFLLIGESSLLSILRQELERDLILPRMDLTFLHTDTTDASAAEPGGSDAQRHASGALASVNDRGRLEGLIEDGNLDAIAISETAQLDDETLQKLLAQRSGGTSIISLIHWAEQHLHRVPPELFSSRWLVQAEGFELHPGRLGWRLKRLGDLLFALPLLLVTSPMIAIAAALIRLEDGGPIFYGQTRTGLYGSTIKIWKLRTMRINAEAGGAQWSTRNDPRITRIGHWLRRLRIDELPQLVSILKGEMSLIGPRPERPEIETDLERLIPHYRTRHWIRPGLSGWAQVCYPYGASIEDSRMKLSYDIFYLRNANLILDFLILIKTIRLVYRGQGATPQETVSSSEKPSRTAGTAP